MKKGEEFFCQYAQKNIITFVIGTENQIKICPKVLFGCDGYDCSFFYNYIHLTTQEIDQIVLEELAQFLA
ncbi:MAG: hypothetical protein AB1643_00710 [Patescibacteria group bacterium]